MNQIIINENSESIYTNYDRDNAIADLTVSENTITIRVNDALLKLLSLIELKDLHYGGKHQIDVVSLLFLAEIGKLSIGP